MCLCGKTEYKSRTEATKDNKYIGKNKGIYHYSYKCALCGNVHLASRGRKKLKMSIYG
jgi:5-methylcytosine-specific restriction endonuclease McrA